MTRFVLLSKLTNRAVHQGLVAFVCVTALLAGGCEKSAAGDAEAASDTPHAAGTVAAASLTPEAQIERGRYLVTLGGCNDCHTPFKMGEQGPEPDMARMLSGHPAEFVVTEAPAMPAGGQWMWAGNATNTAYAGPWGVSFSANLTPDENTGLGVWTEEQFAMTLRTGKHWGQSRPILPPMPWMAYAQMTDEDMAALWAYLRTIPAIHNPVPQPLPPAGADGVSAGA